METAALYSLGGERDMTEPGAEAAQLYPAARTLDWIFPQEKSNLADVGPGIRMRVLL